MRSIMRFKTKTRRTATKLVLICALAVILPAAVPLKQQVVIINNGEPIQVRISKRVSGQAHSAATEAYPFKSGKRSKTEEHLAPLLQTPLRASIVNTSPGFISIRSLVDHQDEFPGAALDYNCGNRSFDTDSGNHDGTDFRSPSFPRLTMANDGLVAIAAADGTIIFKHDGESDDQCSVTGRESAESNRILLQHADGSYTAYASCKNGTLTSRQTGEFVEAGDYLCVVGSSGHSVTPELHFVTFDPSGDLNDPYAGECNSLNPNTLWANQEPYEVKDINLIATHDSVPEYDTPCPGPEIPHFNNSFAAGDRIYFTVSVRDFTPSESIEIEIRNPEDETVAEGSFSDEDIQFAAALSVLFVADFPEDATSGAWKIVANYTSVTELGTEGTSTVESHVKDQEQHTFYIDDVPAEIVPIPENNAYSGLYYDPSLDGEGYNIIPHTYGTTAYFYGSDTNGNRLWLVSDVFEGPIIDGQPIELPMFESTGGVFSMPVSSVRGLSYWGKVTLLFTDCNNGTATLVGDDGTKVSRIEKLAGIAGTGCTIGDSASDERLAGLHYDIGKDGEGYNLIVAPLGAVLYYYGFNARGLRLWLVSELITQELAVGLDLVAPVYQATQGTFDTPVPPNTSLEQWGTATITVINCEEVRVVLDGQDGTKTSENIKLASIVGLECPEE